VCLIRHPVESITEGHKKNGKIERKKEK